MNNDNEVMPKTSTNIWQRGLYMFLFAILLGVAKFVAFAVIVLQFLTILFTDTPNQRLLKFGNSLSRYTYQVMLFLTFNSEEHPYPFSDWPNE